MSFLGFSNVRQFFSKIDVTITKIGLSNACVLSHMILEIAKIKIKKCDMVYFLGS